MDDKDRMREIARELDSRIQDARPKKDRLIEIEAALRAAVMFAGDSVLREQLSLKTKELEDARAELASIHSPNLCNHQKLLEDARRELAAEKERANRLETKFCTKRCEAWVCKARAERAESENADLRREIAALKAARTTKTGEGRNEETAM